MQLACMYCSFTLCLSFSYLRSAVAASFDIKKFHRNATGAEEREKGEVEEDGKGETRRKQDMGKKRKENMKRRKRCCGEEGK